MKPCMDKAAMLITIIICGVCAVFCNMPNLKRPKLETYHIERVELTEMTTHDMQIELNARGHNLVVDGKFGPKTNAALEMELSK